MATTAVSTTRKTKTAQDTLTVALVARQSRTDDGSMSVPDQITAMEEFCQRQNPPWEVGNVYEERDVSGRKPLEKRKGLSNAVADIEAGRAQVLLTAYFDRYVRSVDTRARVVERVEAAGGRVMSMDMGTDSNATAASWLSGTMLAAISEFYARSVGEKLLVSKQRNIDNGVPPFPRVTPAYVRREDGTLAPHPEHGPLVSEACRMRARGESYTHITRWLNANGLTITQTGVVSMLRSRLLVGEIHFGKFKPNLRAGEKWAGVITDHNTFRAMHKATATRGRYAKSERLLARLGVLRCATCNSLMSVQHTVSNGNRYPYYRCGNRLCATPALVAAEIAETAVRDETIALLGDLTGRADAKSELEESRVAVEEANAALTNAIRTLAGLAGETATKETLDELQAARDAAVARHERLTARVTPDMTVTTLADWDRLTVDARRELIRVAIAHAVVRPGRGTNRVKVTGHLLGK